jgi:hypothetical protein
MSMCFYFAGPTLNIVDIKSLFNFRVPRIEQTYDIHDMVIRCAPIPSSSMLECDIVAVVVFAPWKRNLI